MIKDTLTLHLRRAANGVEILKTDRGDMGLLDDAADEIERLRYVLDGVRGAIQTGRNEPLRIWKDQIDIALDATKPTPLEGGFDMPLIWTKDNGKKYTDFSTISRSPLGFDLIKVGDFWSLIKSELGKANYICFSSRCLEEAKSHAEIERKSKEANDAGN